MKVREMINSPVDSPQPQIEFPINSYVPLIRSRMIAQYNTAFNCGQLLVPYNVTPQEYVRTPLSPASLARLEHRNFLFKQAYDDGIKDRERILQACTRAVLHNQNATVPLTWNKYIFDPITGKPCTAFPQMLATVIQLFYPSSVIDHPMAALDATERQIPHEPDYVSITYCNFNQTFFAIVKHVPHLRSVLDSSNDIDLNLSDDIDLDSSNDLELDLTNDIDLDSSFSP